MQISSLARLRDAATRKFGVPVYLSALDSDEDDRFKIELGDEREHFGVFTSPEQAMDAIARSAA
jgi:hypothetical protein